MVLQTITLPEHIFLQVDKEAQDEDVAVGVLAVQVLRADKVGAMSAQCVPKLGGWLGGAHSMFGTALQGERMDLHSALKSAVLCAVLGCSDERLG